MASAPVSPARRPEIDFILTTEKDWARIDDKRGGDLNIAVLTIKIELLEGGNALFDIIDRGMRGSKGLTDEG